MPESLRPDALRRETVVTLLGKPGCHLCEDAHAVVSQVVGEVAADRPTVRLEERSILDDPALEERYRDDIPVVLIDGALHTRWRVDPERLRGSLHAALLHTR